MMKPEEIQVDVGRCVGGSFVRVTHLPTGISRYRGPLKGISGTDIAKQFCREIEDELVERGLAKHLASDKTLPS